jgi:hypothetical protein
MERFGPHLSRVRAVQGVEDAAFELGVYVESYWYACQQASHLESLVVRHTAARRMEVDLRFIYGVVGNECNLTRY